MFGLFRVACVTARNFFQVCTRKSPLSSYLIDYTICRITQPSLTLCENKTTVRDYALAHAPAETRGRNGNRLPKLRAPERTSDKAQFYVYAPDSSECFSFPKRIDSHIRKYGYNYAALCAEDISVRLRCCFDYEKLGCSECMSFLSRNDYLKWENNKVNQSFVNDARDHFARKETF